MILDLTFFLNSRIITTMFEKLREEKKREEKSKI